MRENCLPENGEGFCFFFSDEDKDQKRKEKIRNILISSCFLIDRVADRVGGAGNHERS